MRLNSECKKMQKLLFAYASMNERIKDINLQIKLQEETRQAMRDIHSVNMDGLPHGSNVSDPVASAAIKIVDRADANIRELLLELGSIYDKQAEIRALLSCLTAEEYKIIELRYIKLIKWDFLPSKMHRSRSTCFNIHDRAIKKLIAKNKSLD